LQKRKFSLHWLELWAKCLPYKWDRIIDIRGTGISYFLWAGKRYIWKSKDDKDLRVHQLARWMGIKKTPENKIWIGEEELKAARSRIGKNKVICFSPAANWDKKCWPLAYFAELGQRLTSKTGVLKGYKIAIFGAPDQRDALQPLFDLLPEAEDLVGKINLPTIAAYFSLSNIFVGNDSGLMHLAAATGIKTLGLFGPSPENIYAPWGKNAVYVRTPEDFSEAMKKAKEGQEIMDHLSVENVEDAVKKLVRS
jgi:ADP-heptose:LPS heptosyltransferase